MDLAVRLVTLPPCMCGYLGGVAPAALGRAADEPRQAYDEPRHEDDLAVRGRAAEELLDVNVIDYADQLCCPTRFYIFRTSASSGNPVIHIRQFSWFTR